MAPIYAKVQETLANMFVSLETVKEAQNGKVSDDQILSMSSKVDDLTAKLQACMMSNLDQKAERTECTDKAVAVDIPDSDIFFHFLWNFQADARLWVH
jgi:hypothetical protein